MRVNPSHSFDTAPRFRALNLVEKMTDFPGDIQSCLAVHRPGTPTQYKNERTHIVSELTASRWDNALVGPAKKPPLSE